MTTQTEALKLALEALESCDEGDWSTGHVIHPSYDEDAVKQAMIAIEEALSQPEQDKERCLGCEACIDTACGRDECPKGWTKAPQRTWVWLTDEDCFEALKAVDFEAKRLPFGFSMYAANIQAKLKEKNT